MSDLDTKMTEIDLKLQIQALKQENATLRLTLAEILRQFDFIKSKARVVLARKEAQP